ncbi:hypothetical protein [Lyngbya confervoides]|uniref:Uncharacterized protein n=1 Tax=Lyngbya confervoides BDU141951 TaxID=1574623 RepID=A0ABD4T240_9CYAN|nr:hypothetical protein [Lyngbya confervoides]MCM1982719.1 hypothetical protein [Lyngbya confervoides BDU141951]
MTTQPVYSTQRYRKPKRKPKGHPIAIGLARIMALTAIVNYGLVLFDLSYLSLRDFYLSHLPWIAQAYDKVKGIEPYRDTDQYLKTFEAFQQVRRTAGLESSQAQDLLAALREQSVAMVDENPFELADKSGTLEKIKNRMRDHLGLESSKDSFRQFWSLSYLQATPTDRELDWFERKIAPLIATNYFRPIGESGTFVDYFILIDIWFTGLFALDLLVRTYVIRRRRPDVGWIDALLWRWYDLFLLLPFWRVLRILPVLLRCHQVCWIHLDRIQAQVNHYLAENLLEDMSQLVVVRTLNLAQSAIGQGVLRRWLATPGEIVEINDVNESQEIIERLMRMIVSKVLPRVQPEMEAVLRHALQQGLAQVPLYGTVQGIPGLNMVPQAVTAQVVHQITQGSLQTLEQTLKDQKGQDLANHLAEVFMASVREELLDETLMRELQLLITDMIEEVKLTLIKNLESQDLEQTVTEVVQLRQAQQSAPRTSPVQVLSSTPK